MRSRDPVTREEGFGALEQRAAEFLPQLSDELERESDHGLRCWLLELIGHSGSPDALPILVRYLHHDDESLREWAARGLKDLGTRECRKALWESRQG